MPDNCREILSPSGHISELQGAPGLFPAGKEMGNYPTAPPGPSCPVQKVNKMEEPDLVPGRDVVVVDDDWKTGYILPYLSFGVLPVPGAWHTLVFPSLPSRCCYPLTGRGACLGSHACERSSQGSSSGSHAPSSALHLGSPEDEVP